MSTELLRLHGAAVTPLWSDLNLSVGPGEFIAVLGPNGVGKSTLFRTILGTQRLSAGSLSVHARVGLIPQQKTFAANLPMRGADLVSLSLAHGLFTRRHASREEVVSLLRAVGAEGLANLPVSTMSGGQQQLIRQAQALANDPQLLLADEPLAALDPARQQSTVERLGRRRQERATSIIMITHSINPVIDLVDRVLYLGPRGHVLGTVQEVMDSDVLSSLYGTKVSVARVGDRWVVV